MQLVLYLVHYSVYILINMRKKLHCAYLFADGHADCCVAKVHSVKAAANPSDGTSGGRMNPCNPN